MEIIDSEHDSVPSRAAWNHEPYARVDGIIGSVAGNSFTVHAILAEGDCLYLALPITVCLAWGDASLDTVSDLLPAPYVDRLKAIIALGKRNIDGRDKKGQRFRRLLSVYSSEQGPDSNLEQALRSLSTNPPGGPSTRTRPSSQSTPTERLCLQHSRSVSKVGEYADEGVFEILKDFCPFLRIHIITTDNTSPLSCRHYHLEWMNAFPSTEACERQLSIALHHFAPAEAGGDSSQNHYEAVSANLVASVGRLLRSKSLRHRSRSAPGAPAPKPQTRRTEPQAAVRPGPRDVRRPTQKANKFLTWLLSQQHVPNVAPMAFMRVPKAMASIRAQPGIALGIAWAIPSPNHVRLILHSSPTARFKDYQHSCDFKIKSVGSVATKHRFIAVAAANAYAVCTRRQLHQRNIYSPKKERICAGPA